MSMNNKTMPNKQWAEKLLYLGINNLAYLLNRSTQGYLEEGDYKKIIKKLSKNDEYKGIL